MAQPLRSPTKVNHLAQDLWCLILTFGSGYLLYRFYKRRSETLGIVQEYGRRGVGRAFFPKEQGLLHPRPARES